MTQKRGHFTSKMTDFVIFPDPPPRGKLKMAKKTASFAASKMAKLPEVFEKMAIFNDFLNFSSKFGFFLTNQRKIHSCHQNELTHALHAPI